MSISVPSNIHTTKIKRSDIIIDAIKRMIVENNLKPGDSLPLEKELIEQFNSSRGTIRETLKSLEILGLIERVPGPKGGTRVRAVETREAMQGLANFLHFQNVTPVDIYKVRLILEPIMTESAVGRLNESHFEKLDKVVAISREYLEGKRTRMQCRKAELDFHDIIAEACPNLFLSFICTFINYILLNFLDIESMERSFGSDFAEQNFKYHVKILDALHKENREKASENMAAHMASAFEYIVKLKAIIEYSLISRQNL
jgi:DNA-binding FadR family transcriptional regulator